MSTQVFNNVSISFRYSLGGVVRDANFGFFENVSLLDGSIATYPISNDKVDNIFIATNALKNAIVETGARVMVPLFIEAGDKIKVNTEDGSYLERVK